MPSTRSMAKTARFLDDIFNSLDTEDKLQAFMDGHVLLPRDRDTKAVIIRRLTSRFHEHVVHPSFRKLFEECADKILDKMKHYQRMDLPPLVPVAPRRLPPLVHMTRSFKIEPRTEVSLVPRRLPPLETSSMGPPNPWHAQCVSVVRSYWQLKGELAEAHGTIEVLKAKLRVHETQTPKAATPAMDPVLRKRALPLSRIHL